MQLAPPLPHALDDGERTQTPLESQQPSAQLEALHALPALPPDAAPAVFPSEPPLVAPPSLVLVPALFTLPPTPVEPPWSPLRAPPEFCELVPPNAPALPALPILPAPPAEPLPALPALPPAFSLSFSRS